MHDAIHPAPVISEDWEVLTRYLRLAFPVAPFYHYSCPGCFRNLWSNLDSRDELPCPVHHFAAEIRPDDADGPSPDAVIVFDGLPAEETRSQSLPNLHFESLFSPMVLYTLLAEKSAHSNRTWLLVDPHRRLDSNAVAVANIFAPSVHIWDDSRLGLPLPFQSPIADDSRKIQAARDHLKLLVREPTTRHDLSNVVAPVLLGFHPQDTKASWIVERLRELLECTRGVKQEAPVHSADLSQWTKDNGSIEFLLVDDQCRNGWGHVVCNMLGISHVSLNRSPNLTTIGNGCDGKVTVSISESAEFIVSEIERSGSSDRRFDLRFESDAVHQVLLLDLRLFAGKPLEQEAEFFSRIAEIARLRFCDRTDLPWPGFTRVELDRLQAWLRSAVEGRADRSNSLYLEALGMLPRVLALSDLSLPIMIFSSTTQRKITDRLQDYRNIILEFTKPALLGYDTQDLVAQTSASFRAAVERSLGICAARELCRNVLRLAAEAAQHSTNRRSRNFVTHYELYIDESGSSVMEGDLDAAPVDTPRPFVLGGLLVEYKEALGAEELHKKMEAQNPPLRWWPSNPGDAFLAKSLKELKELPNGAIHLSDDEIIEKFLGVAPKYSVVGVFLEHRDDGSRQPEDEIEALTEADNRYRRMLSYLLETVLFDLLPEMVANNNATLSIFVATRVRTAKDFSGGVALLARLMDRFGFDGNLSGPDPYLQTMDEPFVVSILSEIKKRRDDKLVVRDEHIRGVVLFYPKAGGRKSPKWERTRHQHYLADVVARSARRSRSQLRAKWHVLFKRGIYNIFDARLVALTKSARAVSRGELSAAVLELQNFDFGTSISENSSLWIVLKRLRRVLLEVFSGADFITTSAQIGRHPVDAQQETEGNIGAVKFYDVDRQFGYIRTEGRDCKFGWREWRSATQPRQGESVRFRRISRPDLLSDRVEWIQSLS